MGWGDTVSLSASQTDPCSTDTDELLWSATSTAAQAVFQGTSGDVPQNGTDWDGSLSLQLILPVTTNSSARGMMPLFPLWGKQLYCKTVSVNPTIIVKPVQPLWGMPLHLFRSQVCKRSIKHAPKASKGLWTPKRKKTDHWLVVQDWTSTQPSRCMEKKIIVSPWIGIQTSKLTR